MKEFVLAVSLVVGCVGVASGQQPASVPAGTSPLVGKWCQEWGREPSARTRNGRRILEIKSVEGGKVKGHYTWTGPEPLDEAIEGTINGSRFEGGHTVRLKLELKNGALVGTAERNPLPPRDATLTPC